MLALLSVAMALPLKAQLDEASAFLLKKDTAAADPTTKKKYKPKISGLIAMYYQNEFNTNGDSLRDPDGFRLFKARLEAQGMISEKIGYDIMIDPRTPLHGGLVRDAVLTFTHLKHHTIKVGRQKTPFGWENLLSSAEMYTVNRSEVAEGVGRGDNLRDNGVGIIGRIPISKRFSIDDHFTFTNGTRLDVTGPYDFNSGKAFWGRVGIRYKRKGLKVQLGGSFGEGELRLLGDSLDNPNDDIQMVIHRLGADLQVDQKHFFLAAEYGKGRDLAQDSTEYDEYSSWQVLAAVKTKWKAGPMFRYEWAGDEWVIPTFGLYYGEPKDRFRAIVNYLVRKGVTDVPEGHDDRLYLMVQVRF